MGPRSAGFDEIEAGFAQQAEEDEAREPEYHDQEDEGTPAKVIDAEEDELAIAEREYLNEMRSGMRINEEDGVAI